METKQSYRKLIKQTLSSIDKPLYEDKSYQIAQRLFRDPFWTKAKVIGITVSNPPEADTYQIIRKAWEAGKQVAIPKCNPANKEMSFRILTRFSQLESVFFGLYEPVENVTAAISPGEIDLLIVPGLAFTRSGFRIGHGGGYYDRFLKGFHQRTVSLVFEEQLIDHFPVEDHDIPVMKIITDEKVILIHG